VIASQTIAIALSEQPFFIPSIPTRSAVHLCLCRKSRRKKQSRAEANKQLNKSKQAIPRKEGSPTCFLQKQSKTETHSLSNMIET
jgi:hypothetical protein